jgi:transcriptional regulator with XRE-family HTH domain
MKLNLALTIKPKTVAEYITWQIALCGKTQAEIAKECGFDKPNVITMIKQGKTKVPVNKIATMAKALEVDPVFFLKLTLSEYMPDLLDIITAITGQQVVTNNEIEFIEVIRKSTVINPKLRTDEEKQRLLDFVNTLKSDNQGPSVASNLADA